MSDTTDTLALLPSVDTELVDHLCRHSSMTAVDAEKLVAEVLAYYSESVDSFVRRRHLELQTQGLNNQSCFERIRDELYGRRFVTAALSTRQIRRIIYG